MTIEIDEANIKISSAGISSTEVGRIEYEHNGINGYISFSKEESVFLLDIIRNAIIEKMKKK